MKQLTLTIIAALLSLGMAQAQNNEEMATFRTWAMTPPMGWNSWDCYYSSVTEKEVLQNAQYLVDNDLVKYGWEYVVVDIRWYCNHPSLGGGNYNQRGRSGVCARRVRTLPAVAFALPVVYGGWKERRLQGSGSEDS